jgi:hypothetical protein
MLSAIRAAIKSSPITWQFRHVKGHQDEEADAVLDRWAVLNIQMDNLAKMYWMEMSQQAPNPNNSITGEYWPVLIRGHKIYSSLRTSLYEAIYQQKMATHWEKKNRFSRDLCMQINWEACESAMQRLKFSRRTWIVKHTEGMCGVGKWLLIWKDKDTDECPLCSAPEDARHVWKCPDNRAQAIRIKGLNNISTWMETVQTDPAIQSAILANLTQCLTRLPSSPIHETSPVIQAAIHIQNDIGWENFFEGCIAKEWEQIQIAYYEWCRSRQSGRRWTTALIQKLWDVAWDLWEHRNGIVHAKENAETLHNMAEIDGEIRAQHLRGPQGLAQRDHHLFNGPVADILSASIIYRQKWLKRVETARARAARRLITTYSHERQALRAWLQGTTVPR